MLSFTLRKMVFFLSALLLQVTCCLSQGDSLFRDFSIRQINNEVLVHFIVKGGIQCNGVNVERSVDGISFASIYEFPGICGNPSADESYSFTDHIPVKNKINKYRLQIGNTGLFSETKTIYFYYYQKGEVLIAPHPCTQCTLRFSNEKKEACEISLYNQLGQLEMKYITKEDFLVLGENSSGKGIYYITVLYKDGTRLSGKLIKE